MAGKSTQKRVTVPSCIRRKQMLNSNINNVLKSSQNASWYKKRTTYLRALQYTGTIVMLFSLIAMHGTFFGRKISVLSHP